MNVVSGVLLKVQRYSFEDEKEKGRFIEGGKVVLGIPPEDNQANDVSGFVFQELKADFSSYSRLATEAKGLFGLPVAVECELLLKGKAVALKAVSIRESDSF